MNAQPAIGYMTYQEDGEANRYTIHLDGDWLLSVQHNGRPLTERQKATLHRLTACWNACEGISTEELEIIADAGETFTTVRDRYIAQRNELLEALRRAVDYYPNWKDGAEVEWRAKARALIAKAEGGAA